MAQTARDPARKAALVTPSDSTVIQSCRGIWVGGAGDIAVIMSDDDTAVTFVGVQAGTLLPFSVSKVMSTNTDATNICVVW